jgi:hypothetical protein
MDDDEDKSVTAKLID